MSVKAPLKIHTSTHSLHVLFGQATRRDGCMRAVREVDNAHEQCSVTEQYSHKSSSRLFLSHGYNCIWDTK